MMTLKFSGQALSIIKHRRQEEFSPGIMHTEKHLKIQSRLISTLIINKRPMELYKRGHMIINPCHITPHNTHIAKHRQVQAWWLPQLLPCKRHIHTYKHSVISILRYVLYISRYATNSCVNNTYHGVNLKCTRISFCSSGSRVESYDSKLRASCTLVWSCCMTSTGFSCF